MVFFFYVQSKSERLVRKFILFVSTYLIDKCKVTIKNMKHKKLKKKKKKHEHYEL